jgi:hypothetical protein
MPGSIGRHSGFEVWVGEDQIVDEAKQIAVVPGTADGQFLGRGVVVIGGTSGIGAAIGDWRVLDPARPETLIY